MFHYTSLDTQLKKQGNKMTDEQREMDLQLAELASENRRLKRIEQAAQTVVKSFSNSIDYDTWDKALDALEATLKEKP
jgi:FtsZ-binding cell division protein ZapB